MSTTIPPQPYHYFPLVGDIPPSSNASFDDMATPISCSSTASSSSFSSSSSLLFPPQSSSSLSTPTPSSTLGGCMSSAIPTPMNLDTTNPQYQQPPLSADLAGTATHAVLCQGGGAIHHPQEPGFPPLGSAGVEFHQPQQHHHHRHNPPPPPPPPLGPPTQLLPSHQHPHQLHQLHHQHDSIPPALHNNIHGSSIDANTMNVEEIPRHIGQLPPSMVLPSTERTDQLLPPSHHQPYGGSSSNSMTAPQPKKRGRKPKNYNYNVDASADPNSFYPQDEGELDADGLPKDPRRRRVLERNRIAATKCRLRKRDEASALASREQVMEDQNRHLANCFDSLTAEIYHLKTQLLRHTDCNCILIQRYIANEAKKSVDGMVSSDASSSFDYHKTHHHHSHQHQPIPTPIAISVAPVAGPEPVSPYSYGRLGSSAGSSVDSSSLQTPEHDAVANGPRSARGSMQWTNPFLQPASVATSNPNIPPPPPPLPHPSQQPLESVPGPLGTVQVLPMTTANAASYDNGLYIGMGSQTQRVNDVGWDMQWNFR